VLKQGDPRQVKANLSQSSFFGTPLSPAQLRKRAASHVPSLNQDGQIDGLILELMCTSIQLSEIARRVSDRFPTRFPTWQDALAHVGKLSQQYSL
jgi:hypothetical protein